MVCTMLKAFASGLLGVALAATPAFGQHGSNENPTILEELPANALTAEPAADAVAPEPIPGLHTTPQTNLALPTNPPLTAPSTEPEAEPAAAPIAETADDAPPSFSVEGPAEHADRVGLSGDSRIIAVVAAFVLAFVFTAGAAAAMRAR